MKLKAWATALPGVELPGIGAGDNMLLLLPASTNGARKPGPSSTPTALACSLEGPAASIWI